MEAVRTPRTRPQNTDYVSTLLNRLHDKMHRFRVMPRRGGRGGARLRPPGIGRIRTFAEGVTMHAALTMAFSTPANRRATVVRAAAAVLLAFALPHAAAAADAVADPTGILRKPIPDKLVVLTFDDGPASHFAVVAPILKSFGFGGSFYVCDFDSFRTRKDWYLTWRQMQAMAADGLEIGNHTVGHVGHTDIAYFLGMEDQLLAHKVPKPTTVAWPMYQSKPETYPKLASNGYVFGRGGYFRPYRPTVDNPFDIPSLGSADVDEFVKMVRQAAGGRIVVLTYHGVPDIEHPAVSMEPEVFKAQMQYLKDNHYKVIALRDLAEYIDPVQAAKLPPTSRDFKETGPASLASEEVPVGKVQLPPKPAPQAAAPQQAPKTAAATGDAGAIQELVIPTNGETIKLEGDRAVTVAEGGRTEIKNALVGSGKLVKNGAGQLRLFNAESTYSGGTVVAGGSVYLFAANGGLGSGPLTMGKGTSLAMENVTATNPLVLDAVSIVSNNGFGARWDTDIVLNAEARVAAYNIVILNKNGGGISGRGGLTMEGAPGAWGRPVSGGRLVLCGTNTYMGPTTVELGTLIVTKAAGLSNADPSRWTAENIRVRQTATLQLHAGGPGEFTGDHVGTLLANLTKAVNDNGLAGGAAVALDTTNATGPVTVAVDIADSKGPGGGPLTIKKIGAGTLELTGKNTWSGPAIIDGGTVVVSSINRVAGGKPASSLGAPVTVENGMIRLGGDCTLVYTGAGEATDRIIDLTGNAQTVTFDQSGRGPLKFTSPFDISGYGHAKTVVLKGSADGSGELAGDLENPYDRNNVATLTLKKTGAGTWILSGANRFTGPTFVEQGTLVLATARSLGEKTAVAIADGGKLHLDFQGEAKVGKLSLGGKPQSPGTYSAAEAPQYITGPGTLSTSE